MAAEDSKVDGLSRCLWRVSLQGSPPWGLWAVTVGVFQTGCGMIQWALRSSRQVFRGWFGAGSLPHCPSGVSSFGSPSLPLSPP